MKITELEKKMLLAIPESDFAPGYFDEAPLVDDMNTWTFDVVTTNQDKGVVSSLVKKELVIVQDSGSDESVIFFTDKGFEIWEQIRKV